MEVTPMSTNQNQSITLNCLATLFVNDVCAGKTNETPVAYLSKLRYLERFLKEKKYTELNQDVIDEFRIWLINRKTKIRGKKEVQGSLSPFTIRTVLTTVKHFLKWAHEQNLIPKVSLKNIPEPYPEPKAVSEKVFQCLIEAAQKTGKDWERARNIALLYLLRDTGSRVGAITRLKLEDLDLNSGTAVVLDKGGRYSWLFFSAVTTQAIIDWLEYRTTLKPCVDNLFVTNKGKPFQRGYVQRILNHLSKIAGVDNERHNPHAFRHAFARDTLLAGADLSQTSQLLNHSSIITTARYYARWSKKELVHIHNKYTPLKALEEKRT